MESYYIYCLYQSHYLLKFRQLSMMVIEIAAILFNHYVIRHCVSVAFTHPLLMNAFFFSFCNLSSGTINIRI